MIQKKIPGRRPSALVRLRWIEALAPRDADQLHRFVAKILELRVPKRALVPGHNAPFDYLAATFFEPPPPPPPAPEVPSEVTPPPEEGIAGRGRGVGVTQSKSVAPHGRTSGGGDLIVWANRGGGKTYLGAVATLLDLLFKPGIQVRILGGSFEQSSKMYRYLIQLLRRPVLAGLMTRVPTQRRIELINGAAVEVLAQSERSVRGVHVHKLRCDEVELFKRPVWEAAQMVTRSGCCGGVEVAGRIEAISTMHRPFGLMSQLVDRAPPGSSIRGIDPHRHASGGSSGSGVTSGGGGGVTLLRWCALDVIERCPPARHCRSCPLWDDCQGRAKQADGFMRIDDLIATKHRVSNETWASEIMCQRPRRSDSVYPQFTPSASDPPAKPGAKSHVTCVGIDDLSPSTMDDPHPNPQRGSDASSTATLSQAKTSGGSGGASGVWVGGMDFGLRSPLVMLWARVVTPDASTGSTNTRVEVIDEYLQTGQTLDQHLAVIRARGWPKPAWLGVDPAGGQRNSHTGLSDIQVLRRAGYQVRAHRSSIRDGIEAVRRRLDQHTLAIHPRCAKLIRAMIEYHFDPERPQDDHPVKDGPDHLCDALRYLITNLERASGVVATRSYL